MHQAESAKRYQSVAIDTSPPGQLVLMLFDGALRFMAIASAGFEEKDLAKRIETIHNNLIKAQNILRELQATLNMEKGGEFSERMCALYDYMIAQLNEANLTKDPHSIRIVEKLLGQIRAAWAQMLAQSNSVAA
ncbi:MAG TPA: flagellar export chaperone FliS [Chthoniobacterales bacterium]|jgi:flagellar protein FliS|nr:flagellar export chaperone FliS [Chthoniobacterales bacterium]